MTNNLYSYDWFTQCLCWYRKGKDSAFQTGDRETAKGGWNTSLSSDRNLRDAVEMEFDINPEAVAVCVVYNEFVHGVFHCQKNESGQEFYCCNIADKFHWSFEISEIMEILYREHYLVRECREYYFCEKMHHPLTHLEMSEINFIRNVLFECADSSDTGHRAKEALKIIEDRIFNWYTPDDKDVANDDLGYTAQSFLSRSKD